MYKAAFDAFAASARRGGAGGGVMCVRARGCWHCAAPPAAAQQRQRF
jgi:hypothetical protein